MGDLLKFRKAPVVVRIYPRDVHQVDLLKELKIDKNNLDRELLRQPARYGFWASLYSTVSAKVAFLQEKRDYLEAKLFKSYSVKGVRVTDVKLAVLRNEEYQALTSKLRHWQDAERTLKYAERAFQQRLSALQTVSANVRREWNSEPKSRHTEEED